MKRSYMSVLVLTLSAMAGSVLADGGSKAVSGVPKNEAYQSECSGCHMAYPADLLPAASWKKMMAGLSDHFGDNATMDAKTAKEIGDYLAKNAGDVSNTGLAHKVLRKLGSGEAPLRITELPYIAREHKHELPKDVFKRSDKLTSLSQCDGCHTKATEGSFREREIVIPGSGRNHEGH
ncbi:MAG: diheme cytochrome c [Gammaproteobacteria bacterium]|nr:diheme cytochrome c [Gammaproteobacteria bacterium]